MNLKTKVISKSKPLAGQCLFLETFNEDGTDASSFHKQAIEALGGTVETTFGERCTHLVWSHGVNMKRLQLAAIMEVFVVSPLWIEQCRQAKLRVPEIDFLIQRGKEAYFKITAPPSADNFGRQVMATSVQGVSKENTAVNPAANQYKAIPSSRSAVAPTKKAIQVECLDNYRSKSRADPYKVLSSRAKETLKSDIGKKKRISMADILNYSESSGSYEDESGYSIDENDVVVIAKPQPMSVPTEQPATLPSHDQAPIVTTATSVSIIRSTDVNAPCLPSVCRATKMQTSSEEILNLATSSTSTTPSTTVVTSSASKNKQNPHTYKNPAAVPKVENFPVAKYKKRKAVDGDSVDHNEENPACSGEKNSRNKSRNSKDNSPVRKPEINLVDKVVANDRADAATTQAAQTTQLIYSATADSARHTDLIISVTGFVDKDEAERQSIIEVLRNLTIIGNKRSISSTSASSGTSKATVLENRGEDGEDDNSTCVVMNSKSNRRTLRVLFALAKGVPIVTEEWVYASLCSQHWETFNSFLHPIFGRPDIEKPTKIFDGDKFFILESSNPKAELLVRLVERCGGSVVKNYRDTNFLLIGQPKDMVEWLKKKEQAYSELYTFCEKKSEEEKIVTIKFISESLEVGEKLKNLRKGYHYVSVPPRVVKLPINKTNAISGKTHTAVRKAIPKAISIKATSSTLASSSYSKLKNISEFVKPLRPNSQVVMTSNLGVVITPSVDISSVSGSSENPGVVPKSTSNILNGDASKRNKLPTATTGEGLTNNYFSATTPRDYIMKAVESESDSDDERNDCRDNGSVCAPLHFAKPQLPYVIAPQQAQSEQCGSSPNKRKAKIEVYSEENSSVQLLEQNRKPLVAHEMNIVVNSSLEGHVATKNSTPRGERASILRKEQGRLTKNSKRPIGRGKENGVDSDGELLEETPTKVLSAASTMSQPPKSPTY